MCGDQDGGGSPSSLRSCLEKEAQPMPKAAEKLILETEDLFSTLLELAANNDVKGFSQFIDRDPAAIDEVDLWYGRKKGSKQMVREQRTPLMVAATYGSIDVLRLILTFSIVDVNRVCGLDKSTALHCAASGGSIHALESVELLLSAGGDPSVLDVDGDSPADVIVSNPRLPNLKIALWEILSSNSFSTTELVRSDAVPVTISGYNNHTSPFSSSPDCHSPDCDSIFAVADISPFGPNLNEDSTISAPPEKKEYAVDPSFPDIKNGVFASDEFRMYSFKVRPCSRAYSHDWTECPFVHPGENARRRDPRKYHYSCVPCPEFRKGACRRGDLCEYGHGVFECWLHPAQYRTRHCKDGTGCARRVCFFAHTVEELRPLYMSTGSAVPSPRSSASLSLEMASAMSLLPGSPSSLAMISPSPFSPTPMSPPTNGISNSSPWPPPNVPTLHLPGSSLQSSRLRSSLNARDFMFDDLSVMSDFDELSDFNSIPLQTRLRCVTNRAARTNGNLAPSNLDDLLSAEMISSPHYVDRTGSVFSPSHKAAVLSHFQQQQNMLSPINTNAFSPSTVDHHAFLQASVGLSSPGRMSPRSIDAVSSMSPRVASFMQREKQQQQLRSLSSRDLFVGLANRVGSSTENEGMWSKWDSSNAEADWGVTREQLSKLKSSISEMEAGAEDSDLSWVQYLVKDPPQELKEKIALPSFAPAKTSFATNSSGMNVKTSQVEAADHVALVAWLEQMKRDRLVA